eukprot:2169029-Lingulodinium_polyedra.AAC.1
MALAWPLLLRRPARACEKVRWARPRLPLGRATPSALVLPTAARIPQCMLTMALERPSLRRSQ